MALSESAARTHYWKREGLIHPGAVSCGRSILKVTSGPFSGRLGIIFHYNIQEKTYLLALEKGEECCVPTDYRGLVPNETEAIKICEVPMSASSYEWKTYVNEGHFDTLIAKCWGEGVPYATVEALLHNVNAIWTHKGWEVPRIPMASFITQLKSFPFVKFPQFAHLNIRDYVPSKEPLSVDEAYDYYWEQSAPIPPEAVACGRSILEVDGKVGVVTHYDDLSQKYTLWPSGATCTAKRFFAFAEFRGIMPKAATKLGEVPFSAATHWPEFVSGSKDSLKNLLTACWGEGVAYEKAARLLREFRWTSDGWEFKSSPPSTLLENLSAAGFTKLPKFADKNFDLSAHQAIDGISKDQEEPLEDSKEQERPYGDLHPSQIKWKSIDSTKSRGFPLWDGVPKEIIKTIEPQEETITGAVTIGDLKGSVDDIFQNVSLGEANSITLELPKGVSGVQFALYREGIIRVITDLEGNLIDQKWDSSRGSVLKVGTKDE